MDQWLSNLSPFEIYLIAAPAIMLGAILFLGGIISLLEPRNKNDAEKLAAIRRALEKSKLNDGKR
jgi:predicted phage tail protein